ncbi:MAG: tetratricopeptide repeat protein, partial [Phycisphaerae bacterium]
LTDKTVIELFPTHRAFAVRITGKPWIYTIGACTGRVIALASPRDETSGMGPYDITRVLTHEFTHTVTLAATHNRIPHWFTEGLAVFQENAPRPFTWVTLLAESVRADRLFTLESIDWGFMRPRRPDDRQLAYAQSEWMCEYIVERFGYDALNDMIVRFREGEVQRDVFVDRLKIDPTGFDRAFKDWARSRVKQWGFDLAPPEDPVELRKQVEEHPDDAALLSRLARAEFDRGNYDQARKDARRAIDLDKDEPDALEVLGTVLVMLAREEKNEPDRRTFEDEAEFALRRLLDLDPDGWTAPRLLGEIALRRDNHEDAASFLERLQRHCPMDPTSWRGLAGIHLERGDYDEALPQLTELARIDGGDPQVPVEIARIHKRRGRLPEAQYWYRRALSLDPFSVETHKDLGDTCMKAGDTRLALTQYRILTELEPERARHFESAAYAANKLGDTDQARSLAERAIQLDPSSDARSLLP